jgi:hypothetical protein
MKVDHSPTNQDTEHTNEGFQVVISERAFVALLKAIVFLILFATQGQNVVNTVEAQIPTLPQSQQNHLP